MGSTIGDYVHYNQQNYLNWGINRVNTSPSENWSSAVAALKEQLKIGNEIENLMIEAQELENQYNELFYPSQNTEESSLFIAALKQAIQEMLEQEFGLMAGNFTVENLSVDETTLFNDMRTAINNTKSNLKLATLQKDAGLRQMQNRVNQILKWLDEGEQNFISVTEAKFRFYSAKAEAEQIKNELDLLIKEKTKNNFQYPMKNTDINTLNEIIRDFYQIPFWYSQAGAIFEWMLPFIGINLSKLGKEELVQQMKEIAIKSNKGEGVMQIVIPDFLNNDKITDVDIQQDNISLKTISVRNKTDVQIEYYDKSDQLQTKEISAKNSQNQSVKIADNTTLYKILTLNNYDNFATHYLNVISTSSGRGKNNSSQILEANRLAKVLTLQASAEGFIDSPELLIINQSKESHIYVYNIRVLIYLIQQKMIEGQYTNLISGFSDNYTIEQYFADNPGYRIQRTIAETNKIKITTHLTRDALNQYLNLLKFGV